MISTSYPYHPTQPWTPTQLRTKSEMFCLGPRAPQRAPYFCSSHQKAGASGQFLHSPLRPRVAGTRVEARGQSPDASSSVDRERSQGSAVKGAGHAGKPSLPWKRGLQASPQGCFSKCQHSHPLPSPDNSPAKGRAATLATRTPRWGD